MFIKGSIFLIMIPVADNLCYTNILQDSHYRIYESFHTHEPQESTLEYNYITTEKFIEHNLLKHQDILQ